MQRWIMRPRVWWSGGRRRRGAPAFALEPARSFRLTEPHGPIASGGVYVVEQAFVLLRVGGAEHRWLAPERHGTGMPCDRDTTADLLRFADDVAQKGLLELRGDMGMDGLRVSRWTLMSASRRIELSSELDAQLIIDD
jgi:hypothetical protein